MEKEIKLHQTKRGYANLDVKSLLERALLGTACEGSIVRAIISQQDLHGQFGSAYSIKLEDGRIFLLEEG